MRTVSGRSCRPLSLGARLPRVSDEHYALGPGTAGHPKVMFFFFSNRFGCLPSLALSLLVTVILLWATGVLR